MASLHHTQDIECPLCQEKLKEAHPTLVKWYNEIIKPKFPDCHISWSFRDKDNQEQCFNSGKSKAHFPMSPHNKSDDCGNPCAMALDLFQINGQGMALFPVKYYNLIWQVCLSNSPMIQWGGFFQHLGDFDHFQLGNGDES